MGYSYLFRITVDPDKFEKRKPAALKLYSKLRASDWFPVFGEPEHSGSMGYGTGLNDQFYEEIVKFTSKFPDFTFKIYLSSWDFTDLELVSIKGQEILSTGRYSTGEIKLGDTPVSIQMTQNSLNIEDEITDWFL